MLVSTSVGLEQNSRTAIRMQALVEMLDSRPGKTKGGAEMCPDMGRLRDVPGCMKERQIAQSSSDVFADIVLCFKQLGASWRCLIAIFRSAWCNLALGTAWDRFEFFGRMADHFVFHAVL